MKELLAEPSNHLQSSDTSGSIAWAPDDVFAKVIGKECKGRIRGVGFGSSPSGWRTFKYDQVKQGTMKLHN